MLTDEFASNEVVRLTFAQNRGHQLIDDNWSPCDLESIGKQMLPHSERTLKIFGPT